MVVASLFWLTCMFPSSTPLSVALSVDLLHTLVVVPLNRWYNGAVVQCEPAAGESGWCGWTLTRWVHASSTPWPLYQFSDNARTDVARLFLLCMCICETGMHER